MRGVSRTAAAVVLVLGLAAGAANAQGIVYAGGHVPGAGYAYSYGGPAYAPAVVYQPVVVHRAVVVHQPVVVNRPVVLHRPVVPVVHYAPAAYGTSVRVSRFGRKVEHRTYTPYGVHEWEYRYDRCGRLRDVDYDFDD